jgi:hypothetical protein
MSDNIPKITERNLPGTNYLLIRMCIHCQNIQEDHAVPYPMPFPSVRLAKATMQAMLEDAMDEDSTVTFKDGIVTMVDDEDGQTHQYVQAVIKVTNEIVYRPGDDEQVDATFNDIISGIDFSNPTE